MPLGRLDATTPRRPGREPARLFEQLRRSVGRAARPRPPRGVDERRGDVLIRRVRGEREMPRPLLGIVDHGRGARMQRPFVGDLLVRDGREQWMREAHAGSLELENSRRGRSVDQCRRRARQHRRERRRLPAPGRQRGQPVGDERAQALRERLAAEQLERVVGVAAGRAVQPRELGPPNGRAAAVGEHASQLPHGQRADRQPRLLRQMQRHRAAAAAGHQEPDPRALEPSRDEPEHGLRRVVEPLDVVDGDDRRPRAQHRQQAQRDRALRRAALPRLDAQQRDLQGMPLRVRQRGDLLVRHRGQQVAQRGVGQLRLGLDRTARQDAVRRARDGLAPQRRLADAELTLEQQRSRAVRDSGQEAVDPVQLGCAPDDHENG